MFHLVARWRFHFCLLTLAVSLSPRPLRAAEPGWLMLEAPQFTVFSQLSEKRTRAWSEEFHQFITELRHMFTVKDPELPPLTVVIFARDKDFTPYKGLRPDGKGPRAITGFFSRRDSWSIVGLSGGYATEQVRELIFHEGVHWYMSAYLQKFPVWFEEGVAEVFSTFQQKNGKVQWGAPIPHHVHLLHQEKLLPLERLLFLNRNNPLFNESARTSTFYAQSWLFVHYLTFGKRQGARTALDDYLRALRVGTSADEAFLSACGGDYRQIEDELQRHLRAGQYFPAVIALHDELLSQIKNMTARGNLIRARRDLVMRQRMQEAESAVASWTALKSCMMKC